MNTDQSERTNGSGAAAVLAVAVGIFTLGVFALAGDAFPAVGRAFNWWHPTGPLSGVTTGSIAVWLVCWAMLERRWAAQEIDLAKVGPVAIALVLGGALLTFPPFMDMLQGK